MSVTFEYYVLSDRDLCDGPILRPEECCHICIIDLIKCNRNPLHLQCVGAQRSEWEKKEKCPFVTIQLLWFPWKSVSCTRMLYVAEREQCNIVSFCAKHLHARLQKNKINLGCERKKGLGKYVDLRHSKYN